MVCVAVYVCVIWKGRNVNDRRLEAKLSQHDTSSLCVRLFFFFFKSDQTLKDHILQRLILIGWALCTLMSLGPYAVHLYRFPPIDNLNVAP